MKRLGRVVQVLRTACTVFALLAAGAAGAAENPLWIWKPPASPDVAWRGMLPSEGGAVGAGGVILYPGFAGPAGLLVAIFAHAAISGGAQSAQRRQEQETADKVLEPYAQALKAWPASALWAAAMQSGAERAAATVWTNGPAEPPAPWLEVVPVFSMSQDEAVVILDAAVKYRAPAGDKTVEALVRVLSSPLPGSDVRALWTADGAARLKSTAAAMLAHAVQLAPLHPATASEGGPPMRTHRYLYGADERSERAQQIAGECSRIVLRTLRGAVMSVPVRVAEGSTCPAPATF